MNWRPWIVAASVLAAGIANVALLAAEVVEPVSVDKAPEYQRQYQHIKMVFTANSRLKNFKAMGLPDDMAEKANDAATELAQERGKILERVLKDNSDKATRVFCPGAPLPPPYQALSVLVMEEDDVRRVVSPSELSVIEVQDWYGAAPVEAVFEAMEKTEKPPPISVVMGVSALMVGEEDKAIEGEGDWGSGMLSGSLSLKDVLDDYKDRQIRGKLVDYFALMHLMTEIANDPDKGICS